MHLWVTRAKFSFLKQRQSIVLYVAVKEILELMNGLASDCKSIYFSFLANRDDKIKFMFKIIRKDFFFQSIISVLVLLSSNQVFAGHLTISGGATITTSFEDGKIKFKGSYQIDNSGDEDAQNVFPSFKLGQWSWAGDPRLIAPMNKEIWTIDSIISSDLLSSEKDSSSAGLTLPLKGQFPLKILRHYEDLNGVPFSVADVTGISLGELTSEERSALRVADVNSSFICEGDGKLFSCLLDLRNLSDSAKNISISYHTSQELQVKSVSQVVELGPRGQKYAESKIENINGLPGSSYAVFAVMQWSENGIRQEAHAAKVVSIQEPKQSLLIWESLGAVVLALILLYIFVFRNTGSKSTVS